MAGMRSGYIHYPNDVIYYNGTHLTPLYMPKHTDTSTQDYDICIVGSGGGGMGAAYSLKDKGYKVCIVEKLDVLGGTHTNACLNLISTPVTGTWLKDIMKEALDKKGAYVSIYGNPDGVGEGTQFEKWWRGSQFTLKPGLRGVQFSLCHSWFPIKYYRDLQGTIDIKLRTELINTTLNGTKVESIKVKNLDNNQEYNISAKFFIDCSADGVLCRANKTLDVDYYIGSDPRSRFNETAYYLGFTGDKYDINTVEAGYARSGKVDSTDIDRTTDYSNVPVYSDVGIGTNGEFSDTNLGSNFVIISTTRKCAVDNKVFIDQGNDVAHENGLLKSMYHAKINNIATYCQQNKMLGIRESYRIKCDRMLTQYDCEELVTRAKIPTNHIIALSTWYSDFHNSDISVKGSWFNGIPYESIIPSAFNNVLVASRCYGVSKIAQSNMRLSRTMMSLGYAAGHALSQCVDKGLTDVRNIDIPKLQEDINIIGLYDEVAPWIVGS